MIPRNKSAGTLIATLLVAVLSVPVFAAPATEWTPGTNYLRLPVPKPPDVGSGKVEVNEVFWYGCGHCYALDPTLETWKAGKPAFIVFVRTPVIWGPVHRQHARLYYTLQALKRDDLHPVVFEAVHRKGNMLAAQSDDDARALHLAFLKDHGVTEKAFAATYDSAAVTANLAKAERLTSDFNVASVPVIYVNGTYSTSVSQAGSEAQLLSLINDLAARERRR
jgi:protein dithiol oxidoreductase (disulfide-forming)